MGFGLSGGGMTGNPGTAGSSLTLTGNLILAAGSAAAPSFTFTGDLATGIFRQGAGTIGFSSAGTSVLSIGTSAGVNGTLNNTFAFYTTGANGGYQSVNSVRLTAEIADGASAIGVISNTTNAFATVGAKLHEWRNATTPLGGVSFRGTLFTGAATIPDATGAPGNATQNSPRGRAAIANGAATCVITNDQVTADSVVVVTWEVDPLQRFWVVPGAGSFTLSVTAVVVGNLAFRYVVFK